MASSAEDLPLAAAFARGLEVFTRMQSGDADAEALASGAAAMRHAVARVDVEGVFSRNETKDDVPTENLRYALAPWYLAELASRAPTRDAAAREHALVEVSAMYEAFLERCERHDMLSESAKRSRARGAEACDPATARDEKVARFKRERAIRQRLESLDAARVERTRKALAEADWDDEDPEASVATENEADERERWLLLVERAAAEAMDAAAVVATEREMLARRAETTNAPRHFFCKKAEEEASDDARRRPYRIEASTGMGNYVIGPGGTIEPISAGGYVPPGRKPGAAPVGAARRRIAARGGGARRVPALAHPAHDDGRAARRDRVPRAGGAHAARGGDQGAARRRGRRAHRGGARRARARQGARLGRVQGRQPVRTRQL